MVSDVLPFHGHLLSSVLRYVASYFPFGRQCLGGVGSLYTKLGRKMLGI